MSAGHGRVQSGHGRVQSGHGRVQSGHGRVQSGRGRVQSGHESHAQETLETPEAQRETETASPSGGAVGRRPVGGRTLEGERRCERCRCRR